MQWGKQKMPDGSIVPDLAARFHPFCDLFPAMERKEFSALVLDIRTRGLQVPIMKMGDLILDGRHRYLACKEVGVEPRYEEYTALTRWAMSSGQTCSGAT
jgi:ParB/Sulfiredoxin domain